MLIDLSEPSETNPKFRIHLRSLRSNSPHPMANIDVLHANMKANLSDGFNCHVRIFGDVLGVLLCRTAQNGHSLPSTLFVWQWTTGLTKMVTISIRFLQSLLLNIR